MKTQRGENASMPVSLRTFIPNKPNSSFSGVITGGNGRAAGRAVADVLPRRAEAQAGAQLEHGADQEAVLRTRSSPATWSIRTAPRRAPAPTSSSTSRASSTSVARFSPSSARLRPDGGVTSWSRTRPTGGQVVNQPFTGKVRYVTPSIAPASSLPHGNTQADQGQDLQVQDLDQEHQHDAADLLCRSAVEPQDAIRSGIAGAGQRSAEPVAARSGGHPVLAGPDRHDRTGLLCQCVGSGRPGHRMGCRFPRRRPRDVQRLGGQLGARARRRIAVGVERHVGG